MADDNDPRKDLASHFNELFRRSPPGISEKILSTITSKPDLGFECASGLSIALTCADPGSLDASIRAVAQVLPRTADIIIPGSLQFTFQQSLELNVTSLLWENLQALYYFRKKVTPSHTALASLYGALFSASAVKNGLVNDIFIFAFTRLGIHLPDEEVSEDAKKDVGEIRAIAACLQLVTAGSAFMEKHFAETEGLPNVIAALEALRVKNQISHPPGLVLLEVGLFVLSVIIPPNFSR
jgi:hypothetical protein